MINLECVLELLREELEDEDCTTVMMDAEEARAIVDALDRAESQRDEVAMMLDNARRDGAVKIRAERARADALLAACEEMLTLIRDGTCRDGSVSGVMVRAQAAIDGAKGGGA